MNSLGLRAIGVVLAALAAAACADKPAAASDCAFPVSGGVCRSAPPIPAAPGKSWTIAFDEEFSGSELDRTKLTPCFDWNTGSCTSSFNHGREHYDPAQVVVSGGTAKLIAAPLDPPFPNACRKNGQCTYKAGFLSTARPLVTSPRYLFTFTYGYVEARFKFPSTRGFFTAFWMLPADPTFKYRSEIDILEHLGSIDTMFMTYHYAERKQRYNANWTRFDNGACALKDYSADFVTIGLDWEPDR